MITSTAPHEWTQRAAYRMLGIRDSNPTHSYSRKKLRKSKHFQVWLFSHCPATSLRKAQSRRQSPHRTKSLQTALAMYLDNKWESSWNQAPTQKLERKRKRCIELGKKQMKRHYRAPKGELPTGVKDPHVRPGPLLTGAPQFHTPEFCWYLDSKREQREYFHGVLYVQSVSPLYSSVDPTAMTRSMWKNDCPVLCIILHITYTEMTSTERQHAWVIASAVSLSRK